MLAAECLDDQDVFQETQILAAILIWKMHPHESKTAGPLPDPEGKMTISIQVQGLIRIKLALGKLSGGFLNVDLLLAQAKIHATSSWVKLAYPLT